MERANFNPPYEEKIPRNKLRQLRDRSRLSLSEVSILTNMSVSTISKHESLDRGMSPEAMLKYAKLYKVETHELFYLDGEAEEETTGEIGG